MEWIILNKYLYGGPGKSLLTFWYEVNNYRESDDTVGFPTFNTLWHLLNTSGCVKRIVSAINFNKSKIRNKLGTDTLSGVLHIKRPE